MPRVLSLLPLLLLGCRTVTPPVPSPTSTWELPIATAAGLPVVEVTIGGKKTLLVVDTGAPETTLQAWFVKSLEVEPTDLEGHRVAELPLRLGTTVVNAKWRLVETAPAQRELGIGGTLCPQRTLTKGAVAIDFPRKRLIALDGTANAWLRWLDERSPKGQVEGWLGLDVLQGAVLLVPVHELHPIWFMTPAL